MEFAAGRNNTHTRIDRTGLVVGPKKVQQGRPRATRGKISGISNCLNNSVMFIVCWYWAMWPRVGDPRGVQGAV